MKVIIFDLIMGGCIIKEKEKAKEKEKWKLNWIPPKYYRLEKYEYKGVEEQQLPTCS